MGKPGKRKLAAQQAEVTARQNEAKAQEEALKKTRNRQGRPLLGFINDLLPGSPTL